MYGSGARIGMSQHIIRKTSSIILKGQTRGNTASCVEAPGAMAATVYVAHAATGAIQPAVATLSGFAASGKFTRVDLSYVRVIMLKNRPSQGNQK